MDNKINFENLSESLRDIHKQFENLTDPIRPQLWNYCKKLTGSVWDAEDLLQDTLEKAFGKLRGFWQPVNLKSYLFRIATNSWIDTFRKNKRFVDKFDEDHDLNDFIDDVENIERNEPIENALSILTPKQRVVFLLIDGFDFSTADVGIMINASIGSVKASLHRARKAIKVMKNSRNEFKLKSQIGLKPPDKTLEKFIEAFSNRNPDDIAALPHEECVHEIIGVSEEIGRNIIRKSSLEEGSTNLPPIKVEYGELDGKPAIFIFFTSQKGERILS